MRYFKIPAAIFVCLTITMLSAAALAEEPCPSCPSGCVPIGLVGEFRAGVSADVRVCPAGCTALETVKSMAEKPLCSLQAEAATAAVPPAEPQAVAATATEAPVYADNTRNRIILGRTALGIQPGDVTITGYGAGLWQFEYGVNENLQLGAFVVLPVMVAGVFPSIKAHVNLTDNIALGGGAFGGVFGPFAEGLMDVSIWMIGGHAEMTFAITRNNVINIGMIALGGGFGLSDTDAFDGAILIPNIGFRTTFTPRWSFQVELSMPFLAGPEGTYMAGDLFLLFYGFRGHGELIFGDIGFAMPLFEDYIKYIWKYTPMGIPYFSIGFKI